MRICKICYREFEDSEMKKHVDGNVSDQCNNCYAIIGKGPGYSDSMSDEEAEEWLAGVQERKAKLQEEGKL